MYIWFKNVSRNHIESTCKKLEDTLFAEKYLLLVGGRSYNKLGGPRKLDYIQVSTIMDLLHDTKSISNRDLKNRYLEYYYGTINPPNPNENISISTIHCTKKRNKFIF